MPKNNKSLRTGFTTGSCATAATAAALDLLLNNQHHDYIEIVLPSTATAILPLEEVFLRHDSATATIKKDAGDDPDITNGALISATVKLNNSGKINFIAGEGVGTITKKGLQIPVGEAAINPVPRQMITRTVRSYTDKGVDVTICVAGGEELAKHTFNPRLGIIGGISIIGTSGIVRPFSHQAIQDSVKLSIDVATAQGHKELIFVAGNYGRKAATKLFKYTEDAIIEVSNEWKTALEHAQTKNIEALLLLSHPGKLAKFIDGYFNTHSRSSPSALPIVKRFAARLDIHTSEETPTVEGLFAELQPPEKSRLAEQLAQSIAQAVRIQTDISDIQIVLIDMQQQELGNSGIMQTWKRRE